MWWCCRYSEQRMWLVSGDTRRRYTSGVTIAFWRAYAADWPIRRRPRAHRIRAKRLEARVPRAREHGRTAPIQNNTIVLRTDTEGERSQTKTHERTHLGWQNEPFDTTRNKQASKANVYVCQIQKSNFQQYRKIENKTKTYTWLLYDSDIAR